MRHLPSKYGGGANTNVHAVKADTHRPIFGEVPIPQQSVCGYGDDIIVG